LKGNFLLSVITLAATQPVHSLSPTRRLLFRFSAVLLGLSLFVVTEGVCIIFDWGRPTDFDDPFVGFSKIYPLFVLNDRGDTYFISKSRLWFFYPEMFPSKKGTNTFRVFVLGGSTVAGEPYGNKTSFTTWLELGLRAAEPERDWDVINCGGISYASYRLIPILQETLNYQPDLFIITTGHNEFLEDRTYDHIKHTPAVVVAMEQTLGRFRTFTLLRIAVRKLMRQGGGKDDRRPILNAEVTARLDFRGGMDLYHRDVKWRDGVVAHFEHNLRRLVRIARNAGIPVLLVHESSNLRDSPSFKSEHAARLSEDDLHRFDSLIKEARSLYRTDLRHAAELLEQAVKIDGEYALTWYELGKCYDGLHDVKRARSAFLMAREHDICPLRVIQPLEEKLFRVARETGVPLVDMHTLLEAKSPGGILGDDWLVDHIHPSIEGHQLVADAILEEMARYGWVSLRDGWQDRKQTAYDRHFTSLPMEYFIRGQQTLERHRRWARDSSEELPGTTNSH